MSSDSFDRRSGFEPIPDLVSLAEAATMLGTSRQAVQQQVDRGNFVTAKKIGSTWAIAHAEVAARVREPEEPLSNPAEA